MAGFEWELDVDEDVDVADGKENGPLHDQPDASTFDVDAEELEKELDSAVASGIPIDLNAFSRTAAGFKLAHLWFTKKKRAKLNAKIARLRRQAEQKAHDEGGRPARAGTWSPQNPAGELDVPRTFSSYGTFIPGVTTQRNRERPDPRGRPRSRKFSHMNFVLDVSGSMAKGASPTHPLDVRFKEEPDAPWKQFGGGPFYHTRYGLWSRTQPLMPDPRGPNGGYPRFEIRVPLGLGLPNEGSLIDPTDIRRVCDVSVEVSFAMLQEARRRKNTVSIISFDDVGRLELARTRDYTKAEKVLLSLEPDSGTVYQGALELAVTETKLAGGKAMTILVTDALTSDLRALSPREGESEAREMDSNARRGARAGNSTYFRAQAAKLRSTFNLVRTLVTAGPFFLVCLGVDPDTDPDLKSLLEGMREEYGSNFEVGAFPDVTSEDAVFQAARWSVRL